MVRFGQLLKEARMEKRKKLRDVSEVAGISISYLSDIEQGRKKAPQLDVVNKIGNFLGDTAGRLLAAAKQEATMGMEFKTIIGSRPELCLGLLRATEGLSDDELSDLIRKIPKEGKVGERD